VLCVIGRPRDLPALSKLFSKPRAASYLENRRFFGDFILEGDAELGTVGRFYGFEVPEALASRTLAAFLGKRFGGHPVVGDKLEWEGHTWVVAAVTSDTILKVGLKLGGNQPRMPLNF